MRLELILLALFLACWSLVLLQFVGVVSMAGSFDLGLRGLYSTAVAFGWLAGNVYVHRSRGLPRDLRRRLDALEGQGDQRDRKPNNHRT